MKMEHSGRGGKEELVQLARIRAAQYELDPALVCAVCEQESGWNPWASRFEPGFQSKYVHPLVARREIKSFGASLATEIVQRSCSFGLMQIMGQVARELECTAAFLTELCNPEVGLEYGCIQLKRKLEAANQNVQTALLRYNGGGDPAYPAKVLARMEAYR